MAIVFMFIGAGSFVVLLAAAISGAMHGDWRVAIMLGQGALILIGIVIASWVPVWFVRGCRWAWRRIGAADYFAGR